MSRICILLFLALASCMPLGDFSRVGNFDGVKTALDRESCVSIFMIHGVGGYPPGDPDTLILDIKNKLNLYEEGPPCVREIADNHSGCNKVYGHLTRWDFRGVSEPYHLKIYSLDWLDTTWVIKSTLDCVDRKSDEERVWFARELKREVVSKNVVDAILYTSDYRSEIQYPVIQSIRWIQEDAKNEPNHENFVVGFSLGSPMVIETLDTMLGNTEKKAPDGVNKEVAEKFIAQLSNFFMFSNVSPFFELLETTAKNRAHYYDEKKCNGPTACETYSIPVDCRVTLRGRAVGRFIIKKRETCPNFQIVAFTDPNDPLGYILDECDFPEWCGWSHPFINEKVRNVKWSIFGFINPIDAHIGYAQNQEVVKMIIYGLHNKPCWETCGHKIPGPQCAGSP